MAGGGHSRISRPDVRRGFEVPGGSTFEEDRRMIFVGRADDLMVTGFLGHSERRGVCGADQADGPGRAEVGVAPVEGGSDRFGGEALAVGPGGEDPADLGAIFEGRLDVPMEVGEADLADEPAGGLLLDDPVAKPH